MFSNYPLTARNEDGVPRIISVGRLSQPKDTIEETQQSLQSMREQDEKFLDMHFPGPKHVDFLGEQSSGMIPDRDTMLELWRRIDAKECDLVVAEDISRIFRNPKLQWEFVQNCVDVGVRVICIHDNLDTADDANWFVALTIATVRHGLVIHDTRRRIARKSTTAFEQGGEVGKTRFGYAKVSREDAATGKYGPKGLRIRRLDDLNWVFQEIKKRFLEGEKPMAVVEWLNGAGIPPGPYATSGRWTLKLLQSLLQCPLLHGTRQFRRELNVLVYGTGQFRRKPNADPAEQYVEELAHMTREEQEEILAAVGWRIDWGGVKPPPEPNPRKGISRYQSYWPAQSATCSNCDGMVYAVGKFLRCKNSFRRSAGTCWNHVLAPIAPLRAFVVAWLVKFVRTSAAFQSVLLPVVHEQLRGQDQRRHSERNLQSMKVRELETQERNLRRFIKAAEELSDEALKSLVADLKTVSEQLEAARADAHVEESAQTFTDLSDEAIMANLEPVLTHLVDTSFAMAALVRRFVPECVIVPVQVLDTGQVHPRAKLSVRSSIENYDHLEELVVDLFEPPVYIRLLPEAVHLRNQEPRPTLKQIGAALGTSYMTVKRALAYDRLMKQAGISEPFVELREKPANASRWRHGPETPAGDAA